MDILRSRVALGLASVVLLLGEPATSQPGTPAVRPPPACAGPAFAAAGPGRPRTAQRQLSSEGHARRKAHRVIGQGTLTWRNLERKPCDKLVPPLSERLWNFASTFVFEVGGFAARRRDAEHGYGAIDLSTLRLNGRDVLASAVLDDTLLTLPLATPLGPSAIAEVEFSWAMQLPKAFARSGWADTYHAVTRWFPKIGVWDCSDGADLRLASPPVSLG